VHVIIHWLSWSPGTGQLINIGRDRVLGLGEKSILSDELITILNQKKITVLALAKVSHNPITFTESWIGSAELGLSGILDRMGHLLQ
jgi:hypothetical protein